MNYIKALIALLCIIPFNIFCTTPPIVEAAFHGNIRAIQELIASDTDVNATGNGWTALIIAAQNGHTQIVKTLIAADARVNASLQDGTTALMLAAQDGHTKIVTQLIAVGADINASLQDGWTALMLAAQNNHGRVIATLIAAGADVNATDQDGDTALSIAKARSSSKALKFLELWNSFHAPGTKKLPLKQLHQCLYLSLLCCALEQLQNAIQSLNVTVSSQHAQVHERAIQYQAQLRKQR